MTIYKTNRGAPHNLRPWFSHLNAYQSSVGEHGLCNGKGYTCYTLPVSGLQTLTKLKFCTKEPTPGQSQEHQVKVGVKRHIRPSKSRAGAMQRRLLHTEHKGRSPFEGLTSD